MKRAESRSAGCMNARSGRFTTATNRTVRQRRWLALLAAAAMLTACDRPPDPDATDPTIPITPRDTIPYPATAAGQALAAHVDAITAVGPDAEANYQASLTRLRANPAESIAAIVETYEAADTTLYADRAWLVETLAELRVPSARDALLTIAREPLPERIPTPDDEFSPRTPEIVIRMTAIRGLGHLAGTDDTAAEQLLELTVHEEQALQEQARQYAAIVIALEKNRERRLRLIRAFPGEYRDWVPLIGIAPPTPAR